MHLKELLFDKLRTEELELYKGEKMYYAYIKDNIIDDTSECLSLDANVINVEITEEQFNNIDHYIWDGEAIVLDPDYDEKQAALREAEFKADFFNVQGYGYYRRQPKGYQSAVESMNVLFNIANVTQGLQAGLIIFYEEPDYTKPEECTEEWLVAHQIIMPAMTLQEFMQLYVAFMTAWNTEEHE